MSKPLKKVFKTTEKGFENGKQIEREIELAVRVPTALEKQKARLIYAKAWREAVEGGAIMKEALERYLRDQKIWDDMREKEFKRLRTQILDAERKLKAGGNAGLTKKKAKDLAFSVSDLRDDLANLLTERQRVEANTAEAIAEQAQFNYLITACTVYNDTNKHYFTANGVDPAVEIYLDKAVEKAGQDAASKFFEMWYDTDTNATDNLPEKKFLKDYGFADEKGRLINKDGHLVDREGRLIDENFRFVNENGEFVDAEGNRVDESGQYVVEFSPFLDDDDEEKEYDDSPASTALAVVNG